MNIPKFTLVHRGPITAKAVTEWTTKLNRELPELRPALAALRPKHRQLKGALLASLNPSDTDRLPSTVEKIQAVSTELHRQTKVTTVGIWDLGARVARLPELVEWLNAAQPTFVFFEVQAGIPAGLVSQPERVVAWAKERLGRVLRRSERSEIASNIIANDFFPRAESVRADLGVDYLVGLTPSMVAGEDEEEVYWNHISTSENRTLLVSTQDLRSFAGQAGRPFETLVGCATVAQLLVAMFEDRGLHFHPEDRGCLFDKNMSRVSFAEAAKNPQIEEGCLQFIPPAFRASVISLTEALETYPKKK